MFINKSAHLHLLLDVNVYLDAFKSYGKVEGLVDVFQALPILADVVNSDGLVRLLDSDHVLNLLRYKLETLQGYTEAEAAKVVDILVDISRGGSAPWVPLPEGRAAAEALFSEVEVNTQLLGSGRGRIDDEDAQVLGAAYYPHTCGSSVQTLIVTRDGAFHNVAREVKSSGILVSHIRPAHAVVSAVIRRG